MSLEEKKEELIELIDEALVFLDEEIVKVDREILLDKIFLVIAFGSIFFLLFIDLFLIRS